MKKSFELKQSFNVSPSELYKAWLDSKTHSEMTGGLAECDSIVGGQFRAWDGYISGVNLKLTTSKEIIQSWRTTEFKDSDEDSELTIKFNSIENGTELILTHNNIPEGNSDYEQGWIEHYFEPMTDYFCSR